MLLLHYFENNDWEGEEWDVYCVPRDNADLDWMTAVCARCAELGQDEDGPYCFEMVEMNEDEISALVDNAYEGYYPSDTRVDADDEIMGRLIQFKNALDETGSPLWEEGAYDDYLYKLKLFS